MPDHGHPVTLSVSPKTSELPVAIIGAGPVGLAAAAHLLEHRFTPLIFEAGARVGHTIRQWGHVGLFSPWHECLDPASVRLLQASGWRPPEADVVPTGRDLVEQYLEPLAALPGIAPHVHLSTRVVAVGREHLDKVRTDGREQAPFVLHVVQADGQRVVYRAQAVIDTSGTWTAPNPMGAGGIAATGELEAADRIRYGIPDVLGAERSRYASRRVLVVGGGHSAANVLLDLARLKIEHPETQIIWAIRRPSPERTYGGEETDTLEGRGELGKRLHQLVDMGGLDLVPSFWATQITRRDDDVLVTGLQHGERITLSVQEVIVCTGFRPEFSFLRELRLSLDSALESTKVLAPLIDPNLHSCGTVPPHGERALRHEETAFYIAGIKSYGRAPTFLLLTGYEQVRSIAASLAGDQAAADRVALRLPETGVCSSGLALQDADEILGSLQAAASAGDGAASSASLAAQPTPLGVHAVEGREMVAGVLQTVAKGGPCCGNDR